MRSSHLLLTLAAWLVACVDVSPSRHAPTSSAAHVDSPRVTSAVSAPSDFVSCPELDRVAARYGFRRPEQTAAGVAYSRGGIDCDQDVLTVAYASEPTARSAWRTRAAPRLREAVGPAAGGVVSLRIETVDEADAWEDEAISALRVALVACGSRP